MRVIPIIAFATVAMISGCGKKDAPTQPPSPSAQLRSLSFFFTYDCSEFPRIYTITLDGAVRDSFVVRNWGQGGCPNLVTVTRNFNTSLPLMVHIKRWDSGTGTTDDFSWTYPAQDTVECVTPTFDPCMCTPSTIQCGPFNNLQGMTPYDTWFLWPPDRCCGCQPNSPVMW